MKLAVFGANGPTGRLLTQLALDEDHDVVAFTRHPDTFPIEHERLRVTGGDVHDPAAVASAIEGSRRRALHPRRSVFQRHRSACTPTVAPTSSRGCTPPASSGSSASPRARSRPYPEPLGGMIFEKIMQPYVVNKLGKTVYDDMRRMEAMVSDSDLAWTIVRPSGLFEASRPCRRTRSRSTTSPVGSPPGSTWPIALLRQALSDTYVHSTIAVATPNARPSMLKLIWHEGIRKKS